MPSSDLDQGGSNRLYQKVWHGPSLGWSDTIAQGIVNVTGGGTTTLVVGTTLVLCNTAVAPTIQLPSAILPQGLGVAPKRFSGAPLTIVDMGGHAGSALITILPFGGELIMGLASIQISNPYGGIILLPDTVLGGWGQQ